jgi:hypothetical protein
MTDTGLILGEPSSYLLFTIFLSLFTAPFSLLFPLEDSIKEYYHHTNEETKDYEPYTTVFNPRITKHCDLKGEGVEKGVACDLAEGFLSGVCFALSEMGVEGADGGFYRRAGVLGCGVVVMEQVTRGSKHDKGRRAGVAGGGCAVKGKWGGGGAHGGGARMRGGMGEWWGQ